ncbi:unnamed protein product (macronuclear) [Paramecium tetraurelia]|uniref:C-CAP/cofactor C-like domain-containing protein n=1 Tax=Paramecium tetraurelia TaxID=5888 RepID=A0BXH4_PARTE|nr:uncharacterized protein GSPATT00033094001 [Paramecium tetraurelia]CAK63241.1 unnamed protein product [Paramecium tetraurelia]|eukprot:XP_001430639.1 hypothetical protein (macronuclear) [Paramecium tetraurelia strain d4-2]
MKAKLNREDYQFRKKTGEELIKSPGQLNGLDFVISNCEECTIYICDHAAQIFVDLSKNCKIFIGPVGGSIFVRKCENIEISAASSQFRVSNSNNIQCFVYTSSDPALEKSTGITFAPYNFAYPGITDDFGKAKLDPENNKWSEVFDFTPNTEVNNWTLLHPSQFHLVSKSFEGLEAPEQCPVPIPTTYGGTSTKKIVLGSADQRAHGLEFDFLMGKENVKNQQQLSDENQVYLETQLKPTNQNQSQAQPNLIQGNYEEFVFDEESVKSSEPQVKIETQTAFSAFDDVVANNQSNKQNVYLSQQREKDVKELCKFNIGSGEETKRTEKKIRPRVCKEVHEVTQVNLCDYSDFAEQANQRKSQNRAIIREKVQKEEGWKTVVKNIDLKDNGGVKDVSQMAQAIKNKLMDALK